MKKNKLNEYTANLSPVKINYGGPTENSGLEYKIMPLSFSLSQKGNDNRPLYKNTKFSIGEEVKGFCPIDGNTYIGRIIQYYYNREGIANYVVILDALTKRKVTLDSKSLQPLSLSYKHMLQKNKDIQEMRRKTWKEIHTQPLNEYYIDSNIQMKKEMRRANSAIKKANEASPARKQFLIDVLGKMTYNKFENKGVFSPIYLRDIKLTLQDFAALNTRYKGTDIDLEDAERLIDKLSLKEYSRNTFTILYDGYEDKLKTDVVFHTIDDLIDFFENIYKYFTVIYKKKEINWNKLSKKFREYLR